MGRETPYNLRLPAGQRRTIFREMAKGELRRGPMTSHRHRRLVAYAAKLGIHPTESVQLIREAARDLGLDLPAVAGTKSEPVVLGGPLPRHFWLAVSLLCVVVAVSQLLLRYSG